MASKPQRPGGPSGVARILEESFHVPATPTILREDAAQRVLEMIQARGIMCGRLDLSDQPARRGALFDASGARVTFPEGSEFERCFIALIDPEPHTRWGHPAFWVFVPAEGGADVVLKDTELPESATGPVRLIPFPLKQ